MGLQPLWNVFSFQHLHSNCICSIGGLRAHSAGCWLSQPHLVCNSSDPQTAQSGAWALHLLGAGFLYRILSPTDWISCALGYIIVYRPPSSCGRHNFALIQPVHGQGYNILIFLDRMHRYLHRCISYFDSSAGSKVNMQQHVIVSCFRFEDFFSLYPAQAFIHIFFYCNFHFVYIVNIIIYCYISFIIIICIPGFIRVDF